MKNTQYVSRPQDEHGFIQYPDNEHATWQRLMTRQLPIVEQYACQEYLDGLKILDFSRDTIPQLKDVNTKLKPLTGWQVEQVPALIGFDRFFKLLSERKFPCATFIRTEQDFDYIQEPDIFHELFGHTPMLAHPVYADFMQKYGELGIGQPHEIQRHLARFYWFTVEFGLIRQCGKLKCYGGGILSSPKETLYSIDSNEPKRDSFNIDNMLRTPYRIDIVQPIYYCIDKYEDIYQVLNDQFIQRIKQAISQGDFKPLYPPKETPQQGVYS